MYDLLIIGGGPAGVAAGVYAARKKMNVVLVAESFGGQSVTSEDVQNWIGTKSISGLDLASSLEEHLRGQEGIEVMDGDLVSGLAETTEGIKATLQSGKEIDAKFVLVASGSRRRRLDVPGEKQFEGKGVVYCSTCDAPLFKNKIVAVVGSGNAGLEAVVDLFPYASKIYLVVRSGELKGDAVTQEKIKANPKAEILFNTEVKEVLGKDFVFAVKLADKAANQEKELPVDGVFVEIGAIPNSDLAKGLVKLNEHAEIIADPKTQETSNPRIWAVGDVADGLYKQNNISAGDAVKAVLNIYGRFHKG